MTLTSVGQTGLARRRVDRASDHVLRNAIRAVSPYIEDGAIQWDHLELALDATNADDSVRVAMAAALRDAGITVLGKPSSAGGHPISEPAPTGFSTGRPPTQPAISPIQTDENALAAARRVMERDVRHRRMGKVLLTAEEEVGLGLIIQDFSNEKLPPGSMAGFTGERRRAAETLFLHNTRLAWSVARKYVGQGLELDDLVQCAMIGLIRAVELFDPWTGNKFSTYATWWLRQSVTRAIADEGRLIRVPVHMHERIQKVWNLRERMSTDGVSPRVPDLAKACGLTVKEVVVCLILRSSIRSIDEQVGDGGTSLGELLDISDRDPTAFDLLLEDAKRHEVRAVLDTLSEREAGVVSMRFGLTDDQPRTLDEIGKVYGLTRERIRQIEGKAMEKLRDPSRSRRLRAYL